MIFNDRKLREEIRDVELKNTRWVSDKDGNNALEVSALCLVDMLMDELRLEPYLEKDKKKEDWEQPYTIRFRKRK